MKNTKSLIFLVLSVFLAPLSAYAEKATFAGGCFWCVQEAFEGVEGVQSSLVGYAGGKIKNPTYELVSSGQTQHVEALQLIFDPEKISYANLLKIFWHNIDPTVKNRQFCDVGRQYRSVIYYHTEKQLKAIKASMKEVLKHERIVEIKTEITPFTTFYPAEDYHQKYYLKNPVRYKFYKYQCGRKNRLKEIWGK